MNLPPPHRHDHTDHRCGRHRLLPQRGITLVELLVTVSVLSVIMMLGAPPLSGFMARRVTASQAEAFMTDLRFTRSEALKRNQSVSMCVASAPDASNRSCASSAGTAGFASGWIVFVDRNSNGSMDTGDIPLRVQQALTDRTTSIVVSGNDRALTFRSIGLSLNMANNVVFTPKSDSAKTRMVCLARAGRAKLLALNVEQKCS